MSRATAMAILNWAGTLAALSVCIWFLYRWLRGSREPYMLLIRWGLTAVCLYFLWSVGVHTRKSLEQESFAALLGVAGAVVSACFLAIVWIPLIGEHITRTIGGIYTGGDD